MSSLQATRRQLSAYVDSPELWRPDRDLAIIRRDLEERLIGSVRLFREIQDVESRVQRIDAEFQALVSERETLGGDQDLPKDAPLPADFQGFYREWLETSRRWMAIVGRCGSPGQEVAGESELALAIAEAEAMLENAGLDAEVLPFEALAEMARPSNPDPSRYRD